jgi:hypothetical protein
VYQLSPPSHPTPSQSNQLLHPCSNHQFKSAAGIKFSYPQLLLWFQCAFNAVLAFALSIVYEFCFVKSSSTVSPGREVVHRKLRLLAVSNGSVTKTEGEVVGYDEEIKKHIISVNGVEKVVSLEKVSV